MVKELMETKSRLSNELRVIEQNLASLKTG